MRGLVLGLAAASPAVLLGSVGVARYARTPGWRRAGAVVGLLLGGLFVGTLGYAFLAGG